MVTTSILEDLYDHGDWANAKLLKLCHELSDAQLDQPREMGFGSLRNTLFHILEAEKLWLERWQAKPPRPLVADAGGLSTQDIATQMQQIAAERNQLLQQDKASAYTRTVTFQDSMEATWRFEIGDLLNHVSNHGVHHRAQVLSFLKQFGKTVPAGVDYLFWKMARPSCELPAESIAPLKQYGLEVATEPGKKPLWEPSRVAGYFQYDAWAMQQIFSAVDGMSDAQLDTNFDIGMGTLRKNLQHIIDAQRWWLGNWKIANAPFPRGEDPRSIEQMQLQFQDVEQQRTAFIGQLDAAGADRIVHVSAGGPETCFRVTESLLQLCGHGTHHRAQLLNITRQLGGTPPGIDFITWLRTMK